MFNYWTERGYKTVIFDEGFVIYKFVRNLQTNVLECYVQIVYVKPESRELGIASKMMDIVQREANRNGAAYLTTTISLVDNVDVTRSMKAVLSYGFHFLASTPNAIWFKMNLSNELKLVGGKDERSN